MNVRPLASAFVLVSLGVSGFLLFRLGVGESAGERFLDEATDICQESKRTIDAAFSARLSGQPPAEEIAAFLADVLVPELRGRLDSLEALDPPAGDRDELESLYADYREVIERVAADPAAFVQEDDPFAAVDRRFDDFGLPACGSAPPG